MAIRHQARERALQFLYAFEYASPGTTFVEAERQLMLFGSAFRREWDDFARELAAETISQQASLDAAVAPLLRRWTIDRLPRIDRICLRMALCELRHFPNIPLRVTINEYVDLARLFSSEESTQYINAVLDQLAREFPQKDFQASERPDLAQAQPQAPPADLPADQPAPKISAEPAPSGPESPENAPPPLSQPRHKPRPRINPLDEPRPDRS